MKIHLTLCCWLITTSICAQSIDTLLINEIPIIKDNVFRQRQEIDALTKKVTSQKNTIWSQGEKIKGLTNEHERQSRIIDSLTNLIAVNNTNIVTNSNRLGTEIKQISADANTKISALDSSLSKNKLYWILATLGTILLGGLMYLFLGKRINSSKTDVETQIKNTKKSLEEESVKLDSKLVEVLETQLKIQQETNKKEPLKEEKSKDHSLALKVADEIIRIQKNLSRMEEGTKGLKQLNSSIKRIKNNFTSNGYELVEMIGKEYNEGMKVIANFIPNEDLETGKQIITRIIKPQVNYDGKMIQSAQIEVSIGE